MRRRPGRQERLAGLFVVVGVTFVFAPVIWLL
jgi:preprotein translocase subunit SecE